MTSSDARSLRREASDRHFVQITIAPHNGSPSNRSGRGISLEYTSTPFTLAGVQGAAGGARTCMSIAEPACGFNR